MSYLFHLSTNDVTWGFRLFRPLPFQALVFLALPSRVLHSLRFSQVRVSLGSQTLIKVQASVFLGLRFFRSLPFSGLRFFRPMPSRISSRVSVVINHDQLQVVQAFVNGTRLSSWTAAPTMHSLQRLSDAATTHACANKINYTRRSLRPRRETITKVVTIPFILILRLMLDVTYMFGVTLSALWLLPPKTWSPTRPRAEGSKYSQPSSSIVTGGSVASVNPALLMKARCRWW